MSKVAITATSPLGDTVVAYQTTLDLHRIKHQEPFTDDEIVSCIADPDMIAKTGHTIEEHKCRLVYYRDMGWVDGPPMMKVVAEHRKTPGVLTSAFRTSKRTNDGTIVYLRPGYIEGRTP